MDPELQTCADNNLLDSASMMSMSGGSSASDFFATPAEALSSVCITSDRENGNGTLGPLGMPPKSDKRRTFR